MMPTETKQADPLKHVKLYLDLQPLCNRSISSYKLWLHSILKTDVISCRLDVTVHMTWMLKWSWKRWSISSFKEICTQGNQVPTYTMFHVNVTFSIYLKQILKPEIAACRNTYLLQTLSTGIIHLDKNSPKFVQLPLEHFVLPQQIHWKLESFFCQKKVATVNIGWGLTWWVSNSNACGFERNAKTQQRDSLMQKNPALFGFIPWKMHAYKCM